MDESKIGNKRNIQLSFFVFQFKLKYKKISNKEQEVNIYFCPPIELPKTIISLQRSPKYVHAACKQFKTIAFDDREKSSSQSHLLLARSIHTGMQTDVNLFNTETKGICCYRRSYCQSLGSPGSEPAN